MAALAMARSSGEQASPRQRPVEYVVLQFFHRAGVEAVSLQADDGLLADERGLGDAFAEIQAGGEQARDCGVIGAIGCQGLQLADDLAIVPGPDVGLDPRPTAARRS